MSDKKQIYECGTLRYTLTGVVVAAGLIMMGFFSYHISTYAVTSAVPLRLKELGASNTLIVLIMTTISTIFNMTICPAISFRSDRYRGKRWGRRIVFIIGTLPMMVTCLLLFAFSGSIGSGLAAMVKNWCSVAPTTFIIGTIAVIMVLYRFFYMFVGSLIYYIYNDVIPQRFLARVVGLVQVVSVGAVALFDFCFLRFSQSHFSLVMVGAAIVYCVGIGAMCLLLKEPQLPPLTEEEKKQSRGGAGILTFARESFSHPFYWFMFLDGAFTSVSMGIGVFLIFFYQVMGLSLKDIGNFKGIAGIVGTVIGMAVATVGTILIDKWHPVRVNFFTKLFAILIPLLNIKWIFFSMPQQSFFWVCLAGEIAVLALTSLMMTSGQPAAMRCFPKSRYGQFCSAGAMLRSVMVMIFGTVLGLAIDFGKKWFANPDEVYRFLWAWRLVWCGLGVMFASLMYRQWQKLGGVDNYRAPAAWAKEKFEAMENSPVAPPDRRLAKLGIYLWDAIVAVYLLVAVIVPVVKMDRYFAMWSVPAAAVVLVLWLGLRLKLAGNIKSGSVPHHGLLLLTAAQQGLFMGVAMLQMRLFAGTRLAAQMYCFELSLCAVTLLLLIFSVKLESAATQSSGELRR